MEISYQCYYVVTILIFWLSIASVTYFLPSNEKSIPMNVPASLEEEPLELIGGLEEEPLFNM